MNDLNINNEDIINLKEKALCVGLNLTSLVKKPDDIDIEDYRCCYLYGVW